MKLRNTQLLSKSGNAQPKSAASPEAKGKEAVSGEQPSSSPGLPGAGQERPIETAGRVKSSEGVGVVAVAPPAGAVSAIYEEAANFVLASIRRAEAREPIEAERGMDIARRIMEDLDLEKGLLRLSMDRLRDFALRYSAVNVAILASQIARTLHFAPKRIARIVLAGMLHDIGSARLPKKLLFKDGSLTDAERTAVERVPVHSAQSLLNIPGFEWLPQMIARVHSSGEPERSEAGREFAEDAQVMGISIVFEACIHKRPDREAMTGHQALEELITHKYGFSNQIIKAMIKTFSVYPYNEFVVLNTGEIGQVVDIRRENPMRPTVRVLFTVDRKPCNDHRTVDLAENSSVHIAGSITWKELTSMVETAGGS